MILSSSEWGRRFSLPPKWDDDYRSFLQNGVFIDCDAFYRWNDDAYIRFLSLWRFGGSFSIRHICFIASFDVPNYLTIYRPFIPERVAGHRFLFARR